MNMVRLPSQQEQQNPDFPSYLRDKETLFQTDPARIQTLLVPIITRTAQENYNNRKSSAEDDEIGVFRAEKYFNQDVSVDTSSRASSHHPGPNKRTAAEAQISSSAAAHNLEQVKARLQPKTPTSVRSESSWNCQSVLLQRNNNDSLAGAPARNNNGSLAGKRFLKRLGCSCSDKKSIQTIEYSGDIIKNSLPSSVCEIEDAFSVKPPRHRSFRSEKTPVFLPSGSPDVFGSSPAIRLGMKTMSLERRLTMMTWNRPAPEEIALSGRSGGGGNAPRCDDSDSDASSDLFEIDSLAGKSPNRRVSEDRGTSGCATPTTGYAPSETSIQWSVVTASAADYEVPRRSSAMAQRRRAILGCNSQKSVSVVAGDVYLTSPGSGSLRFRADSPARFQAEMARIDRQFPRLASTLARNN